LAHPAELKTQHLDMYVSLPYIEDGRDARAA
jgi:hypothetical protein